MKKFLLMILLVLVSMMTSANVKQVVVDGITYKLIMKAHVAEIVRGNPEAEGELTIPTSITYEGETYTVKIIGEGAFNGFLNVTSVNIPTGIKTINDNAFNFMLITSLTIGDSISIMGLGCFINCMRLSSIKLGRGCSVGGFSSDIYGIKNVYIGDLEDFCRYSHDKFGCSYRLFLGNKEVTELTLTDGQKEIADGAFSGCISLKHVTIQGSDIKIPNRAFQNCVNIESVTIGEGVREIGDEAFEGCTNLTDMSIPGSVKRVGKRTFMNCSNLVNINLGEGIESFDEGTFTCCGITAVKLPKTLKDLGVGSFFRCPALTSVTIPSNIKTVAQTAFYDCDNLRTVIIHDGVENIEGEAFCQTNVLTDVYCYALQPPTCGGWAFYESNIGNATLHVPANAIEDYRTADTWKDFKEIVAAPELGKCATPSIAYENGKLVFNSETEGVEFVSEIMVGDIGRGDSNEKDLTATYQVSVYAVRNDLQNSDVVTATLSWQGTTPTLDGITLDTSVPVTIAANDLTMVYGDEVPALTFTAEGEALKGAPVLSTTATKTSPVGTYLIKVEQGTVTNRKASFVDGTLTIVPASLTIGVKNDTIAQGEEIPEYFTLTYEGWRNGDDENNAFSQMPAATTTANSSSKPGDYPIIVSGGEAQNYALSYKEGTLTIQRLEEMPILTEDYYLAGPFCGIYILGEQFAIMGSDCCLEMTYTQERSEYEELMLVFIDDDSPVSYTIDGKPFEGTFSPRNYYNTTEERHVTTFCFSEQTLQELSARGLCVWGNHIEANKLILKHIPGSSGISTVTADTKETPVFSLSGQRLSHPQKGINIIGKKKVFVK